MTDREILQSKIDHWHMHYEIEWVVRSNTPSRIGRVVNAASPTSERAYFDYVAKRYRFRNEPRRR